MILSITFSKPTQNCFQKFGKQLTKIKIKPVSKGSDISYFAEMFTEKQVFHKNIDASEIENFIQDNAGKTFFNCHYKTETEEISILSNKKGHISKISRKIPQNLNNKTFPLQKLVKPNGNHNHPSNGWFALSL